MNKQDVRNALLKELNLTGIPEKAQDEVISKLGEIILQSLIMKIYEQLLPEARKEFEEVSKSGDKEKIQEFLDQNVPGINELIEKEMMKTINTFKSGDNK